MSSVASCMKYLNIELCISLAQMEKQKRLINYTFTIYKPCTDGKTKKIDQLYLNHIPPEIYSHLINRILILKVPAKNASAGLENSTRRLDMASGNSR